MANKLNMAIAKTHQVSTRLVGMQITAGNFIAIGLSAVQMTVGFIFLTAGLIAGRWFMYPPIGVIGTTFALLVERLSLGGLMSIRRANEQIEQADQLYYERLRKARLGRAEMDERQLAELQRVEEELKEEHDRLVTKETKKRNLNLPVTIAGMLLSASVGDIFWHQIFEPLGNPWLVYPLSFACAAVIGLTFIYSELYKTFMDENLGDIIKDNDLMKVTAANEREAVQLDVMIESFDRMRKNEEIIKDAQDCVTDALVKDLENFADMVAEGVDVLKLDGQRRRRRVLPAPRNAKRTLYREHKEAFAAFMQEHPDASLPEIQEAFRISRSAAGEWRLSYEQEQEIDEGQYVEADEEADDDLAV